VLVVVASSADAARRSGCLARKPVVKGFIGQAGFKQLKGFHRQIAILAPCGGSAAPARSL